MRETAKVSARRRLEVYREAYRVRLHESLMEDFPRLSGVLGKRRFKSFARDYVSAFPSKHASLYELGRNVPMYLEACAKVGLMPPGLESLARRDLADLDAFLAPDPDPAQVASLDEVSERGAAICLSVHPSARAVPIDAGSVATDAWLAWRSDGELREERISPAELQLFAELQRGRPLSELAQLPFIATWSEEALDRRISSWVAEGVLIPLK